MERRAVPLTGPTTWQRATTRSLVLLCALVLLATGLDAASPAAGSSDINARIASVRASQASLQRSMRSLDGQVARLKAQRIAANKARKQAERQRNAMRKTLAAAKAVLLERRQRLARVEAEVSGGAALTDRQRERLAGIRQEIRVAERRKANIVAQVGSLTRALRARTSTVKNLQSQRIAASSQLRGTEGALSSLIKQMHALAAIKAEQQATVSLSSSEAVFSWPSPGRIVQSYGCTGFKLNPPKGRCRHFHDGIDVVSGYGTPIRAVAVGVVAYSGWNPYDKEGRAYVVDVVHPDGFTSRYGHLIATNHVRPGDLVHTGQVIGKMGNTGKSTGTHLHFELLRGGTDVNPTAYLPSGVVVVDKTTTRAGLAAKNKASRQKERRSKDRKAEAAKPPKLPKLGPSRTRDYPTAEWEDPAAFQYCPDKGKGSQDCDPADLLARLGVTDDGSPGIPRPYREQEPSPA